MSAIDRKARVLQVHNQYAPGWGGEDTVVELEAQMLRDRGHVVDQFKASTADLKNGTTFAQILAVPSFFWSRRSYRALRQRIREFQPDVVHVHNTFPKFSPSIFWASQRAGVPVVQTLHNFRYVCSNSLLLRDGQPCDQCVGGRSWPALRQGCYAGSVPRTAVVAAMNALHRKLGTYARAVDAYILLNDFNREIFLRGGLPVHKLVVKPNFVPASLLGRGPRKPQLVFAGELSRNKGLPLLLQAWRMAGLEEFDLVLIGEGRERQAIEQEFANLPGVRWCGRLSRSAVLEQIATSRFLVFPSLAYENCPMVVLESLSVGTPVVAADHPALQAIIGHQREGLLFQASDAQSLAAALRDAYATDQETWSRWSSAAQRVHAERFSEDANYDQLIAVYRNVIHRKSALASDLKVAIQPSQ